MHVVSYFGFTAAWVLRRRPRAPRHHRNLPTDGAQPLQPQQHGATEEDLHPIVAEAIPESSRFTDWGTRCHGMVAGFTHVQSINFEFWSGRILDPL